MSMLLGLGELAKHFDGDVEIEVDCLSLANAMSPGSTNRSPIFPIIPDIKSLLSVFRSHKIGWIRRNQNKAAHHLAAYVRNVGDYFHLGAAPSELAEILEADCSMDG